MAAALALELVPKPGDRMSPSSASKYLGCGFSWMARYILKVPDPPTGSLTQGKAVHASLGENFRQKIETKRDLDAAAIKAIYRESWDKQVRGLWPKPWDHSYELPTEFRDDEDPDTLKAQGEALALLYLDQQSPSIQPAAVEMPVEGRISGVHVKGFIDLLDTEGRIIDLKTAAKTPTEISPAYRFQVATYHQLGGPVSGEASVHTLVKTKTPKLVKLDCTINQADVKAVQTLYPLAQQGIRAGLFLPNRSSYLCSRKYCSAWRICQEEFGGEVSG